MIGETVPQRDDLQYREYLLSIAESQYVVAGAEFVAPPAGTTRQRALDDLRTRLKQDFSTTDNEPAVANSLAAMVLELALFEDLAVSKAALPHADGLAPAAYLDRLIEASHRTRESLELTYHVELDRSDLELSTPVHENILALQSYLRDGFPEMSAGFFLYKEEWRARFSRAFFPENHYQLKRGLFASPADRVRVEDLLPKAQGRLPTPEAGLKEFIDLDTELCEGHRQYLLEEYDAAADHYAAAKRLIRTYVLTRLKPSALEKAEALVDAVRVDSRWALWATKMQARYAERKEALVPDEAALAAFEACNVVTVPPPASINAADLEADLQSLMPHLYFLLLPICEADVAFAKGDYPTAAALYSLVSAEHLLRTTLAGARPEMLGDLPWGWNTSPEAAPGDRPQRDYPYLNEACELPLISLRLGALYLTWAGRLYRTDREAEVYRARELYKAVLRGYGFDPLSTAALEPLPLGEPEGVAKESGGAQIAATGASHGVMRHKAEGGPEKGQVPHGAEAKREEALRGVGSLDPGLRNGWEPALAAALSPFDLVRPRGLEPKSPTQLGALELELARNPAQVAQALRARTALTQIEEGLNFFGYEHSVVPLLRYGPLLEAARGFMNMAGRAQDDSLWFKERAERAETELMAATNATSAARMRILIEDQRIGVAAAGVQQAMLQVDQITQGVASKKKEIEDHDSLCGQTQDYFGGLAKFLTGTPSWGVDILKSDAKVAFGLESTKAGSAVGLGVVGGMGLFVGGSLYTLNGMADESNKRVAQLEQLELQLAIAGSALGARRRELAVAQLQKAIATLEACAAERITRYLQTRALSVEAWSEMSSFMSSATRRYVDLAASTTWLAERALAYEQGREIRVVSFDHAGEPRMLPADRLEVDLANLEREAIAGAPALRPVRYVLSLAKDLPLQFGQLKANGACSFMTDTTMLELAYPGSFAHRIRTVEVTLVTPVTAPAPRGVLANAGVSYVREATGTSRARVRPPDALPISDFDLHADMPLHQLPGPMLLPFEGSGFETLWTLELPPATNPQGLENLADICLTFHLEILFGALDAAGRGPRPSSRTVLCSARQLMPESLAAFVGGHADTLEFNLLPALFPAAESEREVRNVALFVVGEGLPPIQARLVSDETPQAVSVQLKSGLAHSNRLPPPSPTMPAAPLDSMAKGAPAQKWRVSIPTEGNATLSRLAVKDVILGLEYTCVLG